MKQKRGIFFSLDALIALVIILITVLIAYPILKYSDHETHIEGDVIKVLSNLKVGEIDNPYVKTLISNGKIKDLNKSILQQIGEFYIENISLAKELANATLSSVDNENIGLWCQNKIIFLKNSTNIENSKNIRVERQTISGLNDSEDVTGFSARAYLLNNFQTKYFYFGGYVGEGNLSINMNYNGNLTGIELEIAINNHFNIYINNIYSGSYESSPSDFTPIGYPNLNAYATNFHNGNNIIKIVGDNTNNTHITGGYIKITYANASVYEEPSRYYFPGIEGLINLYDGFYIPSQLNSLNIYLHMNSNLTTYLNIGNTTVFQNSTGGNDAIYTINNSYLLNILNYSQLGSKTIPIRLGLKNISYVTSGKRDADVFSVNDISGSMGECGEYKTDLVNYCRYDCCTTSGGTNCPSNRSCVYSGTCNSNECGNCPGNRPFELHHNIYQNPVQVCNRTKLDLSKDATKSFIDLVSNNSENRAGLVAYSTSALNSNYHYLSNNNVSLKNEVDSWVANGGTCICCGINKAVNSIITESTPDKFRSIVIMSDGQPTYYCNSFNDFDGSGTRGDGTGSTENTNDINWAINASCNAWKNYGIRVYVVGFGSDVDTVTMQAMANCGNGTYYYSDVSSLADVYAQIAEQIITGSYNKQTVFVSSGSINTKLYPDSYIEFNYTKESFQYGIMVSIEKKFSDEYSGYFNLPFNSSIVETRVISYSGPKWTQYVIANNNIVYNLSNYGSNYIGLGDPYSINIPNNKISYANNISLTTGVSPTNSSNGSSSNKIIYKVIKNMSSYSSDIFRKAEGCIWNITFEDNSNLIARIPKNYSGSEACNYPSSSQIISSNYDAVDSAIYNLLTYLDFDSNGKIDLKINQENFEITSSQISGLPYVEYVTVEARTWD